MHLFDIFAGVLSFVVEFHADGCAPECTFFSIFAQLLTFFYVRSQRPSHSTFHRLVNRIVHDPEGRAIDQVPRILCTLANRKVDREPVILEHLRSWNARTQKRRIYWSWRERRSTNFGSSSVMRCRTMGEFTKIAIPIFIPSGG